jgi:hypothetical protein
MFVFKTLKQPWIVVVNISRGLTSKLGNLRQLLFASAHGDVLLVLFMQTDEPSRQDGFANCLKDKIIPIFNVMPPA